MKKKILIIDDSKMVLSFHEDMVKASGYEAVCATNGYEALELFHQDKFDSIITDINMPKMDGYKFVTEVRKVNQEIPIIMVSTESKTEDFDKGAEVGVDFYLVKPLKLDVLQELLNSILK